MSSTGEEAGKGGQCKQRDDHRLPCPARDPGILRAAVQHAHGHVGVYATVRHGGTVRRGDAVHLE